MIKIIGYLIFAAFFYFFRLFGTNENKVFLVATHDDSPEGNIGIVAEAIRKRYADKRCIWFTRKDKITNPINFFVKKAYHLATSGYVFLDNEFLPMAYVRFARGVKVVQLWHGTGTIKRFGQDVNTGFLKRLEYRANQRITHLIVNSEAVKREYASAFAVAEEKIYVIGNPRTDLLLNEAFLKKKREAFLQEYPALDGKRCILYAPTFRDAEVDAPRIALDLDRMSRELADNEVLMLRLHPHVAGHFGRISEGKDWAHIINMSAYRGITTLLAVADVLVTDYSSVIFEYCIRRKPMIFYAYDLSDFETRGRGFYRDYKSFVPGKVVRDQDELMAALRSCDGSEASGFVRDNFPYLDGKSTDRLLQLIF